MTFRSQGWLRVGAVAVLLAGCAIGQNTVAPPLVHLSDMRVKDVRLFEQRYTLTLRIENPNPAELPVQGMAYRVLLNGVEVGSGTERTRLVIAPYDEALVEVDLTSNLLSLLQHVRASRDRPSEHLDLAIHGDIDVATAAHPLPFALRAQLGGRR